MENPFELIIEKLNAIEMLIKRLENYQISTNDAEVLDVNKAAEHLYLSKSELYKLTSAREITIFCLFLLLVTGLSVNRC